ncbi:unnamed protein product, partial [Laminaria digitata]
QGKYAEAKPLYERSQAIREKVLRSGAPRSGPVAQQPGGGWQLRRGGASVQTCHRDLGGEAGQ